MEVAPPIHINSLNTTAKVFPLSRNMSNYTSAVFDQSEITNSSLQYLGRIGTKTLPATSYESLPLIGENQVIKLNMPVYAKKLPLQTRMLVMPPEVP